MPDKFFSQHGAILREPSIVSQQTYLDTYTIEGLQPKSVVIPENTGQLCEVLRYAGEHALSVWSWRPDFARVGNTPDKIDLALDLTRLKGIVEHDSNERFVTVLPGTSLDAVQTDLASDHAFLAIDPVGWPAMSLGTALMLNQPGPMSACFGLPLGQVRSAKFVLASGHAVQTGSRRFGRAGGYRLAQLLAGSAHTLAVMTQVTLTTQPMRLEEATVLMSSPDADGMASGVDAVRKSGLTVTKMSAVQTSSLASTAREFFARSAESHYLLAVTFACRDAEARAHSPALTGHLARACHGTTNSSAQAANEYYDSLYGLPASIAKLRGSTLELRSCVPRVRWKEMLEWSCRMFPDEEKRVNVVLPGTGDVLTFVLIENDVSEAKMTGLAEKVGRLRGWAENLGGFLVIHRAPKEIKQAVGVWHCGEAAIRLHRLLKSELDPKGILNPGRFVRGKTA